MQHPDNDTICAYLNFARSYASNGQGEELAHVIRQYPIIFERHGTDLLRSACEAGQVGIVRDLLQENKTHQPEAITINAADSSGLAPITRAAMKHHWNVVNLLLDENAAPDGAPRHISHGAPTPLLLAAGEGNVTMMKHLIARGANTRYCDSKQQNIAFYAAHARHSCEETLRFAIELIGKKAAINQCDALGNSLLHIAAQTNNIAAISLLRDYGASCQKMNLLNETPLKLATTNVAKSALLRYEEADLFAPNATPQPRTRGISHAGQLTPPDILARAER